MLEFTHDPAWQEERAEKWKVVEDDIKEGLTRKRIRETRTYYMTGIIPDGVIIKPWDAIELYPDPTIEGLQHCLRINFPDGMTKKDFEDTQVILSLALSRLKQLSTKQQAELFRYVAGDTFDPNRRFPFYIGHEAELRTMTISAFDYLHNALLNVVPWIEGKRHRSTTPFWEDQLAFILSLLGHVSPELFTFGAARQATTIESKRKQTRQEKTTITLFWSLLRYCLSTPSAADDSENGKKRQQFLEDFRARFEELDSYPGDLKAIWREIQIQEGALKPNPIENIWRRTTRRGVPNGQSD